MRWNDTIRSNAIKLLHSVSCPQMPFVDYMDTFYRHSDSFRLRRIAYHALRPTVIVTYRKAIHRGVACSSQRSIRCAPHCSSCGGFDRPASLQGRAAAPAIMRRRSNIEGWRPQNPIPHWGRQRCILDALTCVIANVCHLTVTMRAIQALLVQEPVAGFARDLSIDGSLVRSTPDRLVDVSRYSSSSRRFVGAPAGLPPLELEIHR
jgi:hypothetical protein